jgi:hypothetical protein
MAQQSKRFLLRLDPRLFDALRQWAEDDLRSVNAQIEYLLADRVRRAGRLRTSRARRPSAGDSSDPSSAGDSSDPSSAGDSCDPSSAGREGARRRRCSARQRPRSIRAAARPGRPTIPVKVATVPLIQPASAT